MSNTAIVLAADSNYMDHAKSLMVNCRRQGSWTGDFCFLCPQECDTSDLEARGVVVFRAPEETWVNQVKFHLFDPWWRRYERLLYMDCDVLVQGSLDELFTELTEKPLGIYMDSCHGVTTRQDWEHFDKLYGSGMESHPELYEQLKVEFPHIDDPRPSSDVMFFAPEVVPDGTVEKLRDIANRYLEANPNRMDQQVTNLLLHDRLSPLTKDHCTWFAFDDPGNRVPQEAQGWRGDEEPVILHYWNMYAPWLEKTPDAGAYLNHRLGRPCREVYLENLSLFNETFPRRS